MKIDLGDNQSVERGGADKDTPMESVVWVSLRCVVDGKLHQACIEPAVARALFAALREFDNAGMLDDDG